MTIFDLLLIAVFLASVATLGTVAVSALRGRGNKALRILRRWGIWIAIYLGIVIVVSLFVPSRVLTLGEDDCSDDWCIAVEKVDRTASTSYEIWFRVSSRALAAPQRENGVIVYLTDDRGQRYEPLRREHDIPFEVLLEPARPVSITRAFEVPADARGLNLSIGREGFPIRWFIIGQGPFYKPPLFHL